MSREVVEALETAVETLDRDGWCKGTFHRNGGHCLIGALYVQDGGGFPSKTVTSAISSLYELSNEKYQTGVTHFNDKIAESLEDVKLFVKEVIYRLEGE